MNISTQEIHLLSGGQFTLDPGAYFGIVPKPLWNRRFSLNSKERVILTTNVILSVGKDFSALIDSGVGNLENQKFQEIFEIRANTKFMENMRPFVDPERLDYVVQSHLHFDHVGNTFSVCNNERPCFSSARVIVQRNEMKAFRNPPEFMRGNYSRLSHRSDRIRITTIDGSRKIRDGLKVVFTGGHSPGHQAIILGSGNSELIYFGDLIPSTFHVRIPYVTAIDMEPLETIRMKKMLIRKAIRDHALCVFNHDTETPAAFISGDLENPKLESVPL